MQKKELEILESAINCISTLQDCLFKVNERLEKIESQLTTDEVKNAQSAAEFEALSEGIDPKSPDLTTAQIERYYQILNKKMDMIINKEKPLTTGALGEQIAMNAILGNEDATVTTGGNTYKIVDGQFTKVE